MTNQPPDSSRTKILIVDDNCVILRALQLKLESRGYTVFTASDGATAVNTALDMSPDLVLLDIGFPPDVAHGGGVGWDGFGVLAWMRRVMACNAPVIIITGSNPLEYQKRAIAAGAEAIFHKPIDNEDLLQTIKKVLTSNKPDVPPKE